MFGIDGQARLYSVPCLAYVFWMVLGMALASISCVDMYIKSSRKIFDIYIFIKNVNLIINNNDI